MVDAVRRTGAFPLTSGSLDACLLTSLGTGVYTVTITGRNGGTGTAMAEIYDAQELSTPAWLVNISARAKVEKGDGVLIAGFVVAGRRSKSVLIRGIGPGLGPQGVAGFLADPRVSVTRLGDSTPVATNDNWGGDPQLKSAFARSGAFGLAESSRDAALLVKLAPGAYTAVVSGTGEETGVALVEVYDLDP